MQIRINRSLLYTTVQSCRVVVMSGYMYIVIFHDKYIRRGGMDYLAVRYLSPPTTRFPPARQTLVTSSGNVTNFVPETSYTCS